MTALFERNATHNNPYCTELGKFRERYATFETVLSNGDTPEMSGDQALVRCGLLWPARKIWAVPKAWVSDQALSSYH